MKTKFFHLGDVLSIVTGHTLSLRRIDGVYDILNFMTGRLVFATNLSLAERKCKPYLLKQFPQLAEVDALAVNPENHRQWLAEQVAKYGEMFEVKTIPDSEYKFKNPVTGMSRMLVHGR